MCLFLWQELLPYDILDLIFYNPSYFRCVIAELFLEGQPLFELSQLLAYRRGQYDPSQHLEKVRS